VAMITAPASTVSPPWSRTPTPAPARSRPLTGVRQLLAYSFGLDDQDFLVAYETDDLPAFSALVRDLRATDGRRSTVRDTPILTAVHRPALEILRLLGAPVVSA
jgi:chlorite dismutase